MLWMSQFLKKRYEEKDKLINKMPDSFLDKSAILAKFAMVIDQNTRGVQIGIYSIAVVGLAVAIRSVRPFSRFVYPSDIPKSFMLSRIKLSGKVTRIEPGSGAILMVQHRPLVPLIPWSRSVEGLPVRVAGVNITGNGVSWLQTIVAGNDVDFVPVLKRPQYVVCEVTMKHQSVQSPSTIVNIGEELVALGFGTVAILDPSLSRNERYLAYYRRLLAAETRAERRRMGIWHYNSPSPPWHSRLIAELWSRTKHNMVPPLTRA